LYLIGYKNQASFLNYPLDVGYYSR